MLCEEHMCHSELDFVIMEKHLNQSKGSFSSGIIWQFFLKNATFRNFTLSVWNKLFYLFSTDVVFSSHFQPFLHLVSPAAVTMCLGGLLEWFVCCTWKKMGFSTFSRCWFTIAQPSKSLSETSPCGLQLVNGLIYLGKEDCTHYILG